MAPDNNQTDRPDELAKLRTEMAGLVASWKEQARRLDELTAEAEQFRAVADCTYDVECWLGPDGRLMWINPAVERLTGYEPRECLAMTDFPVPLVHPADREGICRMFGPASDGKSGNDFPFRLQSRSADSIWVSMSWQPMHAPNGRYLGQRLSIRDISDRKSAEDRLAQQRELLAGLLANIPSGVYWKARDYRYEGCNEAFARSAGVGHPDDIVGRTDYELAWDPEQADYFRACDRRVIEENRPLYNLQELERQADGRQAVLLTSKVPLKDPDGRVWGVLGIDTDISELKRVETELLQIKADLELRVRERTAALAETNRQLEIEVAERVRAEDALRVSQERYRLVSELTSDYAYALALEADGNWRVEWSSEALSRFTGRSVPLVQHAGGWESLAHPDDVALLEERWRSLQAGHSVTAEFRVIAGSHRTCWLRDHARALRDAPSGRILRIVGAAQDITDRKQAEDEARRHQEALAHVARLSTMGELTGQLAHELNQPLCTVVGNAQTARRLLASPTLDKAEVTAALDDIIAAGKHAADVIRRLRDLVRRQQSKPILLNPHRLMEEVSGFIEADARRHEATVTTDMSDALPLIRGDSIQLQQVILNLVRNGLESMAACDASERRLTIRLCAEADELHVVVRDRGTGLAEEEVRRAFEPFYTTKPGGLGLGLSISRSIAEAHGGRLRAEVHAQGGTAVTLTLPAVKEETQP